jgi:hypothetical protein
MSRHLGPLLSDYVDRRLDGATLAEFDRHVVACQVCRAAADNERALLTSMRTAPGPEVSAGLQQLLLGLAGAAPSAQPSPVPDVPVAPAPVQALRLPVVPPATPALHRSPLRATLLAGLAASASAAVAWGLTAPAAPSSAGVAPVSTVPRTTPSVVQAAFVPGSVGSFTTRSTRTTEPTERDGR